MRTSITSIVAAWSARFALLGALSAGAATVEGNVTLSVTLSNTPGTVFIPSFGEVVKASCRYQVADFHGWESVATQFTVTNTGPKTMWGQCYVAFYDRDKKLLGVTSQGFTTQRGLKPRTGRVLGWGRTVLAKDQYREITSYQAVITTTDKPPSKTKDGILLEDR